MILYHTNYYYYWHKHGKSSAAVSCDYDKKKYKYLETCDFFKGSLENLELSRSKNV